MLARRIAPLLLLPVLLAACAGPSTSGADASAAPPRVAQDPPGLGFAFLPTSTGLLVRVLAEDGPAVAAGLRERDLVTAVSGREMAGLSREAIAEWLSLAGSGRLPVVLDVPRGEASLQVTLTPAPYDREALAAATEARFPSPPGTRPPSLPLPSLDDLPDLPELLVSTAMRQFSDAMSRGVDAPRAERDGTHLVITSPACAIRIPVTETATPEGFFRPIDGSLSQLHIASTGTGVYCTDVGPNYQDLSAFTFSSVADRDRAVETGRSLLRAWPRDAFAPSR